MRKPYYQDNAVTIYHGDCREILPELGTFDLLLTDPPYGIGADSFRGLQKHGWVDYGVTNWNTGIPSKDVFDIVISSSKNKIIWGGNYFTDFLPASMGWLVWDKGQREFSLADGELAWTSFNKALRIKTISRSSTLGDGKQHPTQKSLDLIKWCILYADRNSDALPQSILDPFMGSGTTLRAAKDLNRKAVEIELEEKYCEIAAKRMCQEVLEL